MGWCVLHPTSSISSLKSSSEFLAEANFSRKRLGGKLNWQINRIIPPELRQSAKRGVRLLWWINVGEVGDDFAEVCWSSAECWMGGSFYEYWCALAGDRKVGHGRGKEPFLPQGWSRGRNSLPEVPDKNCCALLEVSSPMVMRQRVWLRRNSLPAAADGMQLFLLKVKRRSKVTVRFQLLTARNTYTHCSIMYSSGAIM